MTSPLGLAQLMCNADKSMGIPTDPLIVLAMGLSRVRTVESEHVSAPAALSRLCVTVFSIELMLSPPARIKFLIAIQSRARVGGFE